MNAQQFLQWMRNPGQTAREEGAQLDALLDSFPYFQSGHLLYIKNLHNQGSFLYNNQLKTAAAYAVNRKVLYELITRKEVAEPKPVVQEIEEKVVAPEVKPEEVSVPPKFPVKRFVNNPDEWEAGMLRQLQLLHHWKKTIPLDSARDDEKETREDRRESVETKTDYVQEEKEEPGAKEEINTLLYVLVEPGQSEDIGEDASEELITTSLSEESSEDAKWEIISPGETKEEPEIKLPVVPVDTVQQDILIEAIHSTFELEVDDKIPSPEEMKPFRLEPIQEPESATEPVTGTESVVVEGLELSFSQWLKEVNKTVSKELPKTALTGDVLIEQFIQDEPRIKVKKSGFFNPVNMAKKSVQESDEFVTETLARIYAKQGNHHKAIRAYQKLSLKFPEKTAYFAALIEELKRTPNKPTQK